MAKIELRTIGASFTWWFDIREQSGGNWIDFKLAISAPDLNLETIGSLSRKDILRLTAYIREHIGPDRPCELDASPAYVPQEMDFRIHALEGEIESFADGEFAICVMIPHLIKDSGRVYRGAEAMVDVVDALRWCDNLDAVLSSDE